jgi:hypothetical protein
MSSSHFHGVPSPYAVFRCWYCGAVAATVGPFVHSLRRGLSQALPTMDRRAFLRRSGLGVGVGLAATQLALVKKAQASSGQAVWLWLRQG